MRVLQHGSGARRHALAAWFCGVSISKFAKLLPSAMIVEMSGSKEPVTRTQIEALVRADGATLGELGSIGFSAGCHGVRNALEMRPDFIIPVDGTHGSIPQPGGMPIAPWQAAVDRARRGECSFVSSCSNNTYVEKLRPPNGPYYATVSVLRKITGWDLPEPTDDRPHIRIEDRLAVYSYRSADADAAAHRFQIQVVAPELVRQWLSLRWASSAPAVVTPKPLGPLLLAHGYRCAVSELVDDARATGTWHPAGDGYEPQSGDLLVSGRSGGDPTKGGQGHVEIVKHARRTSFVHMPAVTIGGNESNTWVQDAFDLGSRDYKGCIERGALGRLALELARVELDMKIAEISGSRHNPRIQEYHAGARRKGSALAGMPGHLSEGGIVLGENAPDEIAWCASSASWCYAQAVSASLAA